MAAAVRRVASTQMAAEDVKVATEVHEATGRAPNPSGRRAGAVARVSEAYR